MCVYKAYSSYNFFFPSILLKSLNPHPPQTNPTKFFKNKKSVEIPSSSNSPIPDSFFSFFLFFSPPFFFLSALRPPMNGEAFCTFNFFFFFSFLFSFSKGI